MISEEKKWAAQFVRICRKHNVLATSIAGLFAEINACLRGSEFWMPQERADRIYEILKAHPQNGKSQAEG